MKPMPRTRPGAFGWSCVLLMALLSTVAAAVQQPALPSDASVLEIMERVIVPESTAIFDVTDPPAHAADWAAIGAHATALVETERLLLAPSRARDQQEWTNEVRAYAAAITAIDKAAKSKNFDAFLDASDALGATCANCHAKYLK